jgi:hypothetical protein
MVRTIKAGYDPETGDYVDPFDVMEKAREGVEWENVELKTEELYNGSVRELESVMKKYYNESQIMDDGTLLESIIMELAELICVQDLIDKEDEEERKNSLPTGDPKEDSKDE